MKPTLRRFIVSIAVIAAVLVLVLGWLRLATATCDYGLIYARVSPTERYVAELYRADCGIGEAFSAIYLRDQSAVALPSIDGAPPGTLVSADIDPTDAQADISWDGEATLVLHYGDRPPRLERAEWGGVRIEARRGGAAP